MLAGVRGDRGHHFGSEVTPLSALVGIRGDRGLVVPLKLVLAPFRFGSDDPLGVGGCSRPSRACCGAKTSFGNISIRK